MIKSGDIVQTSYGTGPYRVARVSCYPALRNCGSYFELRDYVAFSLVCRQINASGEVEGGHSYLNGIFFDGREYHTEGGDKIIVVKQASPVTLFDLLPDPELQVYDYQPGVRYDLGLCEQTGMPHLSYSLATWRLWRCNICKKDFHVASVPKFCFRRCQICPSCGWAATPVFYFSTAKECGNVASSLFTGSAMADQAYDSARA